MKYCVSNVAECLTISIETVFFALNHCYRTYLLTFPTSSAFILICATYEFLIQYLKYIIIVFDGYKS